MPFLAAINAGFVTSRVVLPGTGASGGEGEGSGTPDTIDKATGGLGLTTNGASDSQWFEFNGDGTSLFVHNTGSGGLAPAGYLLNQFNLTTPYDLTTASYSNNVYYGSGNDFEGKFAGDGSKFYYDSGTLWQHNLSSAFVPGTDIRASGEADGSGPSGESFCFKNDGTKLYTLAKSNTPNGVIEYDLSTAWDITTNSLQGGGLAGNNFDYSGQMTGASNIEMNSTGTKFYIYTRNSTISGASIAIVEYDMTTPWDINSGTYNGKYLNVGADGFTSLERISFRLENDNKIFIKGQNSNHSGNDVIYQYTIPNASSGGGNAAANGFIVRNNFTGMSNERFYGIGTDSSNNFYATGYDAVDDNILIAKYNSSGTFQWARKAANAGNGPDRIFGSQVDSSGNVITGGYSYSHSGGSPYPALITKYQADGTHVYTKVFTDGGSASWIGQATAIDSNDNFYITGRGRNQSSNNNDYTFVAKLNSAGAMVWIQKLDHGGQQSNGKALAIDSDDNVIVAGTIHEEITGGGYSSGFVAKLSGTDGSITWQRIMNDDVQANGYHNDSFMAVTVDSNKDVYTTGYNNFEYLGTSYSPIVKLSGTDGSVTWQRRHLTTNGSTGISAVGTSVYVVTDDNKILIYNASGTLTGEWVVTATSGSYYTEDIKSDQNGNAVVVGFYYSTGSQAEPFFAVLPATIIAGTSDNFILTAGSLGDVAGTLATNAFTTISSNAVNSITVSNASNMASSTQASDGNVITAITGGSSGSGNSNVWYGDRGIVAAGGGAQNSIEYFDITTTGNSADFGDLTTNRNAPGAVSNGSRGVIGGGSGAATETMDYITISTAGNATSFGNFSGQLYDFCTGASNGVTGLFGSPDGSGGDIDYITIDTTGNAQNFGNLTNTVYYNAGTGMDATYALWAGGMNSGQTSQIDVIDYVTIATPGNAVDFGDLSTIRAHIRSSIADTTRSVFAGGASGGGANYTGNGTIDYVTTATPGNATDFGDLSVARGYAGGSNNATRAFVAGGWDGTYNAGETNIIDYFEIQTPGNATDFGDILSARYDTIACAGSPSGSGGGGGGGSSFWGGDRAVYMGGYGLQGGVGARWIDIGYLDMTTTANTADFGDLTKARNNLCSVSNGTRVFSVGGQTGNTAETDDNNRLDYITTATLGNATDAGNLDYYTYGADAAGNTTRSIIFGGYQYNTSARVNTIQYFDPASPGNTTDFGDLQGTKRYGAACNSATRALTGGGDTGGSLPQNRIDYITIDTTGNSATFGNLAANNQEPSATSDETRGIWMGGYEGSSNTNRIQYVTMDTTGNTTDFGNLTTGSRTGDRATSNNTRGLFMAAGADNASNEYIIIQTTGNATDLSDLTNTTQIGGTAGSGSAS